MATGRRRGHTDKTPEGKAASLEALEAHRTPPGEARLTHGVYAEAGVYMRCDRCPVRAECGAYTEHALCEHEQLYVTDRRAQVAALPFVDEVLDGPALSVLLWTEVRLQRAARYLAVAGETTKGLDQYTPLAREVTSLVNSWRQTLTALNLTPGQRRRLAIESTTAGTIADVFERMRVEDAQEAEFSAEDAPDPAPDPEPIPEDEDPFGDG